MLQQEDDAMENALIVASSDKGRALLSELLQIEDIRRIIEVSSGSQARRMLIEKEFELVIISTPLPDEFGHEFALWVAESTSAGVILLVKGELTDAVSSKVEDYGVFVVEKPIARVLFYQALKLVKASQRRVSGLKKENAKLQHKIAALKLIDRAKCTLIQYLNMSEEQAHKYIEKQAMDRQLTREKVAESILKMYES